MGWCYSSIVDQQPSSTVVISLIVRTCASRMLDEAMVWGGQGRSSGLQTEQEKSCAARVNHKQPRDPVDCPASHHLSRPVPPAPGPCGCICWNRDGTRGCLPQKLVSCPSSQCGAANRTNLEKSGDWRLGHFPLSACIGRALGHPPGLQRTGRLAGRDHSHSGASVRTA